MWRLRLLFKLLLRADRVNGCELNCRPFSQSFKMSQSFREEHPQFYVVLPEDASFWTKCKALPKHPLCYVRRMNHNFGWRFEGLLTSAYLGVKGFLVSLLYTSLQPFFLYHMQLDGVAYQMFQNMALSPFDMKAFIGFVSDIFPIRCVFLPDQFAKYGKQHCHMFPDEHKVGRLHHHTVYYWTQINNSYPPETVAQRPL